MQQNNMFFGQKVASMEVLQSKVTRLSNCVSKLTTLVGSTVISDNHAMQISYLQTRLDRVHTELNRLNQISNTRVLYESDVQFYCTEADYLANDFESLISEIENNVPTVVSSVSTANATVYPGVVFGLMKTDGTQIPYITKCCLRHKNNQYVVGVMQQTGSPSVFVIQNNLFLFEQDHTLVNYLLKFCQIKGYLN